MGPVTRVLVIDGHPDPKRDHFIHACADAYADAASKLHQVRRIDVGALDFPLLRSQAEWTEGEVASDIADAQRALQWAEHLVLLYPMWLGDVPALLKGFLEQVARPGFALRYRDNGLPEKLLKGKSARVIISMGMPAFVYRLVYRAHSLKALERNVLKFVGFRPVRHSIIGSVESSAEHREQWLETLAQLGARAA